MSKIISVSNETYENLTKIKGEDSFSKVIMKLISKETSNKNELMKFFGKGGIDTKKMSEIKEMWKEWDKKYV